MKITAISAQVRDKNRVNVLVDGGYLFSLDISQLIDLSIKVGNEYTEAEIDELKDESAFGKLYSRTLEYCLIRPRSSREVKDYLYKKTLSKRGKDGILRDGVSKNLTERVFSRLSEKKYIDDYKFAIFWVENRFLKKGVSTRRLEAELIKKGIASSIISEIKSLGVRNDESEIKKIIAKKINKYDHDKMIMYLARQGFNYDDIKSALDDLGD